MTSLKVSILLFFMSLSLQAGTDIITQLEAKFKSITDFQAEFEQIETSALLKREKKSFGVIYSLPQGKIFWHTQKPYEYKVISDGTKIWLYDVQQNQVMTETWGELDSQAKLALLFFRREGNLKKSFKISIKEEKESFRLLLLPRKKMNLVKVILNVSKEKIFFNQIIFYFPLKRVTTLNLMNIQFNQNLLEKYRERAPDKNVTVDFQFLRK